jgi:hypothetical protein
MRILGLVVLALGSVYLVSSAASNGATLEPSQAPPPWRREVILWKAQIPGDSPWRRHEDLQGKLHPEYPDDLEVLFRKAATEKYESMWVRVIAFDPASREYLGILLNSPYDVPTIEEGDNVAFGVVLGAPHPVAVAFGGSYRRAGLPNMSPPAFFEAMAEALNQYRQGGFGHNPPGIEAGIAHFSRSKTLVTDETGDAAKFYLHFFIALCFAEKYETLAAVDEFRQAISLRPDDEDAQMGLLAELSVLVNNPPETLPKGDSETWVRQFEAQVATMRSRFPREAGFNKFIDNFLSDNPATGDMTSEQRARAKRVGTGTFRWKMK